MNLAVTPVVLMRPTPEAGVNANDIEQIEQQAGKVEAVAASRAVYDAALAHRANLQRAQVGLNTHCRALLDRIRQAEASLEAGLVAQFANGATPIPTDALAVSVIHAEAERRAAMRVISTLVEQQQPEATIAELRARSKWLWDLATEIIRVAHERFEKTAEMMRDATSFEGGLSVDIRSTFSGVLLRYAEVLRDQSERTRQEAAEAERSHQKNLLRQQMPTKK